MVSQKKVKQKRPVHQVFIDGFGSWGYFFVVIQWIVVFALYFKWITEYFIGPMQSFSGSSDAPQPQQVVSNSGFDASSPLTIVILSIFALAVLGLTIYVIYKMPKTISDAGSKAIKTVATKAAPVVLKVTHKHNDKKSLLLISGKFMIIIKGMLIFIPIVLALTTAFIQEKTMTLELAILTALICAVPSLLMFAVQYLLAIYHKVPLHKVK